MESKYQYRQRKVELDTVKEFRLVEGHQWLFVFVTPQFHHWYHSSEKPAIDTNYSAHLVFFDWLFGTYHMPKEHWPAEYGTTKKLRGSFIGQLMYPLTDLLKLKP